MSAAEIIALVAVGVTGVSVVTNYLLSRQRLDHEQTMQDERLALEAKLHSERLSHERAEAVRTTAAAAYSKANAVLAHINSNTIAAIAHRFGAGQELGPRQAVSEAMDALGFVSALGWSAEVRDGAAVLLDAISKLASTAWVTAGAIRRENPNEVEMMQRLDDRFAEGSEALDAYRRAVAGE